MSQNTATLACHLDMETYKKILHILYEEYNKYTEKWILSQKITYNLNRLYAIDVCINNTTEFKVSEEFKEYINRYMRTLMQLQVIILKRIFSECSIIITGRIKNEDSIKLKMLKKSIRK